MEQFILEKYLENPSRKVVTRGGREVEILKTDFRGYKQIIGVVKNRDNKDDEVEQWDGQGNFRGLFGESKYDLFFADEEEELTEFEKAVEKTIPYKIPIDMLKSTSQQLFDLARKELEKEYRFVDKDDSNWENGHKKGKQDALKDLPKWKKANVFVSNEFGLATRDDDLIITHYGYQIKLSDLETLPKEE